MRQLPDVMAFGSEQIKSDRADLIANDKRDRKQKPIGTIEFIGNVRELDCWVHQPEVKKDNHSGCADETQLQTLLHDNKILLDRYWQISQLNIFKNDTGVLNGQLFLNINKLIAADIKLNLSKGNYDTAYQSWLKNNLFISRLMTADVPWIGESVFMISYSFSLNNAAILIDQYPDIIAVHGDELLKVLKPTGLNRWNLAGIQRAEYQMINIMLSSEEGKYAMDTNFIRNRFYRSAKAYLMAAKSAPDRVETEMQQVGRAYSDFDKPTLDYLFAPKTTILSRLLLRGSLKASMLVTSMHNYDGKLRTLTLALLLKKFQIPQEQIESFIANASADLKNPFSGQPIKFNSQDQILEFDAPGSTNKFYVHLKPQDKLIGIQ